MKVVMKKTMQGSDNGFTLQEYIEGTEHDLTHTPRSRDLAQVFVREGWAVEVKDGKQVPVDDRAVARLPLLEEYVARGYKAENYDAFIAETKAKAEATGYRVEIRAVTEKEKAEEALALAEAIRIDAQSAAENEKKSADAKAEEEHKAAEQKVAEEAAAKPIEPAPTKPVEAKKKSQGGNK